METGPAIRSKTHAPNQTPVHFCLSSLTQFQITTPRAHPRWLVTYSTLDTARRRPLAEGLALKEMDSHMGAAAVEEGC